MGLVEMSLATAGEEYCTLFVEISRLVKKDVVTEPSNMGE